MHVYFWIWHWFQCTYKVVEVPGKGKGVVATSNIGIDDFVCEYTGEILKFPEAKSREEKYIEESAQGDYQGYMFFFNHSGEKLW